MKAPAAPLPRWTALDCSRCGGPWHVREDLVDAEPRPVVCQCCRTVFVVLPIRLRNPMNGGTGNTRLAGIIKSQQRAEARGITRIRVQAEMRKMRLTPADLVPSIVYLTRVSAGKLDGDSLQASFKGVRDGVADVLGVDDGGRAVDWHYAQRKGPVRVYAVEVEIIPRDRNPEKAP